MQAHVDKWALAVSDGCASLGSPPDELMRELLHANRLNHSGESKAEAT